MDTKALLPLKVSYCRKREYVQRHMRHCACLLSLHVLGYGRWKVRSRIIRRNHMLSVTLMVTLLYLWLLPCFSILDYLSQVKRAWNHSKRDSKNNHTIMLGFRSPGQRSWGPFKQRSTPLSPADTSTVQLLFNLHVDCISQVPTTILLLLHQFLLGGTVTWTKPASPNFELRCFTYNGSQNRMLNHRQENKTQYQNR